MVLAEEGRVGQLRIQLEALSYGFCLPVLYLQLDHWVSKEWKPRGLSEVQKFKEAKWGMFTLRTPQMAAGWPATSMHPWKSRQLLSAEKLELGYVHG